MIKNRCKITIKALNQERVLNSLSKKMDIFDLQRQHNTTQFYIERKNRKMAKNILSQCNVQVISIQRLGVLEWLRTKLKNYGMLIAIALILILYPLQYSFVWNVAIFGGEKGLNQQVECCVKNKAKGLLKWQINTKEIETSLRNEFDEISSVSVAIVGQSLIVSINQSEVPDEMKECFDPIVSECDAKIEMASLVQGTLAVKQGDIVRKGQVLVWPFIIDSQGQKRQCQPKAEIIATVWFEGKAVCYDSEIITKRTGNKFLKREVYLNNILLYTSAENKNYMSFEEETSWQNVSPNNLLPLKIKRTWIYETVQEQVYNDFSQIKDQVIENARKKTLIFLQKHEIIKEENYTIREGNGWHEVCFVIAVERNIGG